MRVVSRVTTVAATIFLIVGGAFAGGYQGLNNVAPNEGFSDVSRAYPNMNEHYVRYGKSLNLSHIRSVRLGQTQDSVSRVLGQPVAEAGDGSWYFVLNLPYLKRSQFVCQYRVFFDSDKTVSATVWRRPQCADIVTGKLR